MALTGNRKTPEGLDKPHRDPVAAAKLIFKGAGVVLDSSGNAEPASTATGKITRGVALEKVDNSAGSAGDEHVTTLPGIFGFLNSAGGDEITEAEIGDVCYWVDDQTVAKTSTGKSVAGVIKFLEGGLVYVDVGTWPLQVGLLAASNLSDVGSAATARANLGTNVGHLQMVIDTLVGTGVTRIPLPDRVLTITKIKSTLQGALATGDATLTFAINAVAITGGVITIAQSGSAAGDLDEVSPSAANVSDGADDELRCTVGGTNTAAVKATITVEYTF